MMEGGKISNRNRRRRPRLDEWMKGEKEKERETLQTVHTGTEGKGNDDREREEWME